MEIIRITAENTYFVVAHAYEPISDLYTTVMFYLYGRPYIAVFIVEISKSMLRGHITESAI